MASPVRSNPSLLTLASSFFRYRHWVNTHGCKSQAFVLHLDKSLIWIRGYPMFHDRSAISQCVIPMVLLCSSCHSYRLLLLPARDFFRGLPASDRFFLHLPDLVRSRSFDHFPFFTLGAGMTIVELFCAFPLFKFCYRKK